MGQTQSAVGQKPNLQNAPVPASTWTETLFSSWKGKEEKKKESEPVHANVNLKSSSDNIKKQLTEATNTKINLKSSSSEKIETPNAKSKKSSSAEDTAKPKDDLYENLDSIHNMPPPPSTAK